MTAAYLILLVTRIVVLSLVVAAAIVALTQFAVKRGYLTPFGALPRTIRGLSEPLVKPLERRLLRSGGNPVNAPYVLFLVALAGGLVLLALVQWGIGAAFSLAASASLGPRGIFAFIINGIIDILMLAILIRVISSWFAISPYSKPMRVIYGMTNWLIEPLHKVIPPLGMIDVSPLVAYFLLYLVRWFLLGWL
jgi:YggT family protein